MSRVLLARESRRSIGMAALLLLCGAVYALGYLGLASRWWFEDDPALYAYTNALTNPFKIFSDPAVLRHFTVGKSLVPMQLLSYWVDIKLAGFSPKLSYAHQTFSFLATLLLIYLLVLEFLPGRRIAALLTSLAWMFLPSTAVILQFLATRHYLEGLLLSLLAIYLLVRLRAWPRVMPVVVAFTAAAGMLCKETYAVILLPVLLLYAWKRRDHVIAISVVVLTAAYGAYRFWMLGPALDYGIPFLTAAQYFRFLTKLPYTISSNYGGYVIAAVLLALGLSLARQSLEGRSVALSCAGFITLSLAVIFPVSYPLFGSIRTPDPWYRILFVLNTILVLFGCWIAAARLPRRWQAGFALIVFAIVVPGSVKTRRLWARMTASAEQEGKFYLNNPDKVLLSQQIAWWFIPGVNWMYAVKSPHYVLLKDLPAFQGKGLVPLWRFRDGQFRPEPMVSPRTRDHSKPK